MKTFDAYYSSLTDGSVLLMEMQEMLSLLTGGEIVSIYLLPEYFRKGYGQRLLKTALIDMKTKGYKNCYLWVLKENSNARQFYESIGFICNDDECTCEIMKKQLVNVRYILKNISQLY